MSRQKDWDIPKENRLLRLLYWLSRSEAAKALAIPYRGVEVLTLDNNKRVKINPGEMVSLGTQAKLEMTTGITTDSLIHLYKHIGRKTADGVPHPPIPEIPFWINLVELIRILKDQGTPLLHPDDGSPIVYEDQVLEDGSTLYGWELARHDYESQVLPEASAYWSKFIYAYHNPSEVVTSWDGDEDEGSQSHPRLDVEKFAQEILNLPLKRGDRQNGELLKQAVGTLSPEGRQALFDLLRSDEVMKDKKNLLVKLAENYMQSHGLQTSEALAINLMSAFTANPETSPQYPDVVNLCQIILSGAKPQERHIAWHIVMGRLATVLHREDGTGFAGSVIELMAHCFPKPDGNSVDRPRKLKQLD